MNTDFKKTWRKKTRELLAKAFGGKCTICGYDKCIIKLPDNYAKFNLDLIENELPKRLRKQVDKSVSLDTI